MVQINAVSGSTVNTLAPVSNANHMVANRANSRHKNINPLMAICSVNRLQRHIVIDYLINIEFVALF